MTRTPVDTARTALVLAVDLAVETSRVAPTTDAAYAAIHDIQAACRDLLHAMTAARTAADVDALTPRPGQYVSPAVGMHYAITEDPDGILQSWLWTTVGEEWWPAMATPRHIWETCVPVAAGDLKTPPRGVEWSIR